MSNYTADVVRITSNRALIYEVFIDYVPNRKGNKQFKTEGFENRTKGELSQASKKRIMSIIDTWTTSLEVYHYIKGNPREALKNDIGFLTLTLPSKQAHTDRELKRLALNPFLIWLRRSQKVTSHLWVAEKQKNGNLHFHIVVNQKVHYEKITRQWNNILRPLGYIEQYRQNQLTWHSNGFRCREELTGHWDIKSQYRAYLLGMAADWQHPNSTDIHSLKRIDNVGQYFIKELTKGSRGLPVDGKIYGNSDHLSHIKPFTMQNTWEVNNWLKGLAMSGKVINKRAEKYDLYRGLLLPSLKKTLPQQYRELQRHYMHQLKVIGYRH